MIPRLRSRQVHLDFHTSGDIPAIGSKFDKKQFQEALRLGHVNSMTVFGKCHHGYHYFPTKVGTLHPGLTPGRDFSGEMMEACHEIGVRAPLYLTLGWSALDAAEHPEWIARGKDGSYLGTQYDFGAAPDAPKPECSWIHLCSAGSYRDYLCAMTREACERYDQLDGLFFDIVFTYDACYCDACVRGMRAMGMDPSKEEDAKKYYQIQKHITLDSLNDIIRETHPDATVFYNSGGAEIHMPQWHYASTHFEMEDLPTRWGGYDKMPLNARYFTGTGKDTLGMTGKFHRSWGEFGGFKTPEALTYEVSAMMSNGVRASVGDQLHPDGHLDPETYRNIGQAYAYAEKIEDWCFDCEETARLGILVTKNRRMNAALPRLLLDSHLDFDVVHTPDELSKFETVLLADGLRLNASWGAAVDSFIKAGGKLVLLGGAGLKENEDVFAFETSLHYEGHSIYDRDFFQIDAEGIVSSPILCYTSAHRISGGETLAHVRNPYFSRTYGHYCSHFCTPFSDDDVPYPAAAKCGNVLYIAHELAGMYADYGNAYHRRYFCKLMRRMLPSPAVEADLPVQGRVHMARRKAGGEYVVHLLYGSPIQRGEVAVMEDFPELRSVRVTVRVPQTLQSAVMVPQNTPLELRHFDNRVEFTVPSFSIHQMIVLH